MRTLSSAEAAELLGVSPRHVAKLIRRGVLPGYPVMTSGGRVHAWRVTADGLDAYQRASSPPPQPLSPERGSPHD